MMANLFLNEKVEFRVDVAIISIYGIEWDSNGTEKSVHRACKIILR